MPAGALLTERLEAAVREHERRTRAGEAVDLDAFCAGFADLAPHLRRELEMHAMLGGLADRPVLEQIGAELGDYQLHEEIGRGGMGAVFRARDRALGRDVAIKVVAIDPLRPERAERLLREARAIARIRHPHVVEVHAFGRTERWMYLVMELKCGTLADRMAPGAGDADRLATVRRWMCEAAEGLAHCHDHGIVHRDIKPENLLVDAHGAVAVADFGLARAEDLLRVTETGHVLGTLGYTAPELLRGEPADVRSDVYALGACLHALLAGQPPPRTAAPWRALPATTPPALRALVARAMAADRAERLPDAHALAAALRTGAVGPRRPRSYLVGAGLGAAAIAGAVVWTSARGPTEAARPAVAVVDPELPVAGGFVLSEHERWLAENEPPAASEREPGARPSPPNEAWERRLTDLSRMRELSRARAVEFDDAGATYLARIEAEADGIAVVLEHARTVRARVALGREQLAGHPEGWGIYFETADEDGDGHKEIALVRADDALASIRIVKLDPQAWIAGDTGWRRVPPPGARFGAPSVHRTDRPEVQALDTGAAPGAAPALASFALDTGAALAPPRAIAPLRPQAPRVLDDGGALWLEVGDAAALVVAPEDVTWRWRSSARGAAAIATWRAIRTAADGGWAAVALDVDGIVLAGLRATALAPVEEDPHLRHLLAAARPASSRQGPGDEAMICAAGGDTIACVAPPRGETGVARRAWQVRVRAGDRVAYPPAELADLDGDGLAELAAVGETGRLYIVSARGGGTVIAEHALAARPSAPPVWLAPERCVVVTTASRLACASVDGEPVVRTIADVEYAFDRHRAVRRIAARRGDEEVSLLAVTIDYGYHRGVQVIDPRTDARDPRLWRYATGADLVAPPAIHVDDGTLWLAFADEAGALYAVPAALPAELRLD